MATHNDREINAQELYDFINSIDSYLEKDINFYALGGTALTMLGFKNSTRDIDVNTETDDYNIIIKLFTDLGFTKISSIRWITQEGLQFDLFHGNEIMGINLLDDSLSKAKLIKDFGNIKLYTLSLYDIIITKLARGDSRDFDDIKTIFEKENIEINELISRYKETMKLEANYKQKLLDLIQIYFFRWEIKIDQDIINEVEKWE